MAEMFDVKSSGRSRFPRYFYNGTGEIGRSIKSLKSFLSSIPSHETMFSAQERFSRHTEFHPICAYINSFGNLRKLLGHPTNIIPILIETKADLEILERRAGNILKNEGIDRVLQKLATKGLHTFMTRALLADKNVFNCLKNFLDKPGGERISCYKGVQKHIAVYLASRKTREATISFLNNLNTKKAEPIFRELLNDYEIDALFYYLGPVYESLKEISQNAGKLLAEFCHDFKKISGETKLIIHQDYSWEHWLFEDKILMAANIEPQVVTDISKILVKKLFIV